MTRPARHAVVVLLAALAAASCGKRAADYVREADRLAAAGRDREAIAEYRKAIEKDPRRGDVRWRVAGIYERTGELAEATREFAAAADLMPANADAQLKGAAVLLIARRFEEARTCADRVLERDPSHLRARILHANAMAGLKQSAMALDDIKKAVALDPTQSRTFVDLGLLQIASGAAADGEISLRSAIAAAPASAEPYVVLASFFWAQGQLTTAEQELKRALAAAPRDPIVHRALAAFYLGLNRAGEAEQHLRAIAESLRSPETWLALADYYIVLGRTADATAILTSVSRDHAAPAGGAHARLRLAALAYAAGRTAEGHAIVDQTIARDARARLTKAQFLLIEGKADEAVEHLKAAVAAEPRWAIAHHVLAVALAARQQLDAAALEFGEVLRLDPQSVAARLELARLNLARGQAQAALELAEQAGALRPENVDVQLLVVRALIAGGLSSRAETLVRRLVQTHADRADVQAVAGMIQHHRGDEEIARPHLTRAMALQPTAIEPIAGIVASDLASGQIARARALVTERLAKEPAHSGLLVLAAQVHRAGGDDAAAEAALRRAMESDPANPLTYDLLGQVYLSQRKLDAALAQFQQLTTRDPRSVPARTMLGLIFQLLGKSSDAEQAYKRVLEINPRAAVAANNLAWLYADQNANLDVALQLAQLAKEELPEHPDVNDTLGWVFYRKDLPERAIAVLQLSVERRPNKALYRYHLGLAFMKTGDLNLARVALQQALKIDPSFPEAKDARQALLLMQ